MNAFPSLGGFNAFRPPLRFEPLQKDAVDKLLKSNLDAPAFIGYANAFKRKFCSGLRVAELSMVERFSSFRHRLNCPDFNRWVDNVKRGSEACGCLLSMGYVAKHFGSSDA